ncbi:MAG: hypothetical protein PHG94_06400 [Syntrophomonas sp.]|uniref:hypothetical protein n=1 Tax=Syntrophomonas sp. TaxID=2053627 RepID=UPI002610AD3B|nr:hypothetical protein [Syntrophomonas sp.]MDD2510744.1 hypothetical protein [Syntrophomonas sp.]MDD4627132.1 hypothetical protein [Syntrophomonas sp.]
MNEYKKYAAIFAFLSALLLSLGQLSASVIPFSHVLGWIGGFLCIIIALFYAFKGL